MTAYDSPEWHRELAREIGAIPDVEIVCAAYRARALEALAELEDLAPVIAEARAMRVHLDRLRATTKQRTDADAVTAACCLADGAGLGRRIR